MRGEYARAFEVYGVKPDQALRLLSTSLRKSCEGLSQVTESAAFTVVSAMLLNLDETITHE
jgi:hypothetical protein